MPQALILAAEDQLVGSLCKRHAVAPQKGSDRLQTDGFRFYFTPLFGVLLTFPSRYWSTVGLPGVFSLAGWSPRFRPTQVAALSSLVARTGVSPAAPGLSRPFRFLKMSLWRLLLPRTCLDRSGLGSCRFARHYCGNRLFSFSSCGY